MVDEEFQHPRLASIYDALDPDRSDLDAYVRIAAELDARRVLDVGCGTGTLALMLAERGYDVVAVDPAAASVSVARSKDRDQAVRWLDGDASTLDVTDQDLALITGNAAQSISEPEQWAATLRGIHRALRVGGHLVFETRDPAVRAWERWSGDTTHRVTDIPGVGSVTSWVEVTAVDWPLVSFRWTWTFAEDGATLTSDSTLRFRERDEIQADLIAADYAVVDVRDAPDRPGMEWVFIARAIG